MLTVALLIPIAILFFLAVLFVLLFFWKNEGKINARTIWYTLINFFVFGIIGAIGGSIIKPELVGVNQFLVFKLLFLLIGVFHSWYLYRLYWSKRNSFEKAKDSFWPELLFTLFLTCFSAIAFVLTFEIFSKSNDIGLLFGRAILAFLIPFLSIKTYDFAQQIEPKEFSSKWFYSPRAVDDRKIDWNKEARIHFRTARSMAEQESFIPTKREKGGALYSVDDTSLGELYNLWVQRKNNNQPGLIKDLNTVNDNEAIWWLFRRKFILWNPKTWGKKKYLTPDVSLRENDLQNDDTIIAIRMLN